METILELREKLADLIIEYDKTLRDNLKIESYYNAELGDLISELTVLEGQVLVCQQALKMDKADLDLDVIIANINKMKTEINKSLTAYSNKKRDFNAVVKNINENSPEALEKLEADYSSFVKNHHPALIVFLTEAHAKTASYLRSCFLLNDVKSFNDFTHKEVLLDTKDIEYTEEQPESLYIERYQEYIKGFTSELEKVHKYDEKFKALADVIADDMLIARNENDLRNRIYAAKEKEASLIAQCEELFPEEVEFKL